MKLTIKLLLHIVAVAMILIGLRLLLTDSGSGWLAIWMLVALSEVLEVLSRVLRKEAGQD